MAGLREASNARPEKLKLAIDFLQKAVQLDPGYNAALAEIADVTMYQCVRGYLTPETALRRGLQVCSAAIDNNASHVSSRVMKAWFEGMIGQRVEEGLAALDEALGDDPEYAAGYAHRSWFMRAMGDAEAAARDQEVGYSLNPHSLLNRHGLAITWFHRLDVDAAAELERELAEIYPDDDIAHAYLAMFTAYMGNAEESLRAAARSMELSGDIPSVAAIIAYVEAAVGSRSKASELVRFALEATRNRCPRPLIIPALLKLGRKNEAIELLLASKRERCPWFYGMRTDPRLTQLAHNSRLAGVGKLNRYYS
jgi:tetratricopeptide (TPR) repeat protein